MSPCLLLSAPSVKINSDHSLALQYLHNLLTNIQTTNSDKAGFLVKTQEWAHTFYVIYYCLLCYGFGIVILRNFSLRVSLATYVSYFQEVSWGQPSIFYFFRQIGSNPTFHNHNRTHLNSRDHTPEHKWVGCCRSYVWLLDSSRDPSTQKF